MKLFPDASKRKQFMKGILPFVFGIAWAPIISITLITLAGQLFASIVGWSIALLFIAVVTVLLVMLLIRLFIAVARKVWGESL